MKKRINISSRSLPHPHITMVLQLLFLLVLCVLVSWAIYLTRDKLLKNANEMGMNLAQSYAMEEENRSEVYSLLMSMAVNNLNDEIERGEDIDSLRSYLQEYSHDLHEVLGTYIIDPYAVVDGHIIGANSWEGDSEYDYWNASWYQDALENEGIIFSNVYKDVITNKDMITLSCKLSGQDNVLAFDIFVENYHVHRNRSELPEDGTYFLFDSTDQLIYTTTEDDVNSEFRSYVEKLVKEIRNEKLRDYNTHIVDVNGNNRGVYYYTMDNGWISVITIPFNSILHDGWDSIIVFLVVLAVATFSCLLVFMILQLISRKKSQDMSETLQILGDSYYAMYQIYLDKQQYRMIKQSEYMNINIPSTGSYIQLLHGMKDHLDDSSYRQLLESFSLKHIEELIASNVNDFGGDCKSRQNEWINVRIVHDPSLEGNKLIMCFRQIDLQKQKELERQDLLENALQVANQTVKKKMDFFSNASHDMRTPLNAVVGLSKLAKDHVNDPNKVLNYLNKIEFSGQQLLTLINDILEMSRLEQNREQFFDLKPVNLNQIIKSCVGLFEEKVIREKKHLSLNIDLVHAVAYVDDRRLTQILNNVISNSFKYSLEGATIDVTIKEVDHQAETSKYQFIVKDTGIGMSEEFLKHIFEPFSRENTFVAKDVEGTGLGMPIIQTLVHQMSGEIVVDSVLHEGTCVTITLPLQTAQNQESQEEKVQENKEVSLENRTFLVAEDNEINMEITCEMLSMLGAKCLSAYDGAQAITMYEQEPEGSIDCILMDLQMPNIDGCKAAQTIRSSKRSDAKTIPIIALTANVFAEDIAKTSQAGMNEHIGKPIDFTKLMNILAKYFDQKG